MSDEPKIPKELDDFVDKVLAYKPQPKSKAAKRRKKRMAKIANKTKPSSDMSAQK